MKTMSRLLSVLALTSVVILSCQKELSFERGSSHVSVGSLQTNANGGCLGAVVNGTYKKDSNLNASHYVNINVQVDTIGTYTIKTDTVNGYYFSATGSFTQTGVNVVKLVGAGKPLAAGPNIFTVSYNGTICDFPIDVTATAGGGGSSQYTVDCSGATLQGTWQAGTATGASNTVTLPVTVTTAGTWSISTATVNGVSFSGSGTFTATGAQSIILSASGTPTNSGNFNYAVIVGAATCNFSVTFAPGTPIIDYFPRTTNSNWTYEFDGDPADTILRKVIANTLTAAGNTYNIFMANDGTGFDSSGYYRKAGSNYYEWIDISVIGYDDEMWVEYNFLRDNVAQGGTWQTQTFSGPVNGVTVESRFSYTIMSKDVSVTVNGTNYQNVIVVKEELQVNQGGNWVTLQGFVTYSYARNIGLIKMDFDDGTGAVSTMDITRSQVF